MRKASHAPDFDLAGINFVGFNQDQTCLAVGTTYGFMIFSTENFAPQHREDCGEVSLIEMLFQTPLLALVVRNPHAGPCTQLTLWNTKDRCPKATLTFPLRSQEPCMDKCMKLHQVHGVKMNHRRLVVLLRHEIHILSLHSTTETLRIIDRISSPCVDPALGWLCASHECGYLATPFALAESEPIAIAGRQGRAWSSSCMGVHQSGLVDRSVQSSEVCLGLVTIVDTYTLLPVGAVLAHRHQVRACCLNPTGQLLATASSKGTVVRLFAVPSLELLFEFRRGVNECEIFGLLFSWDSTLITASAASGTVHIFKNEQTILNALRRESEEATTADAEGELISNAILPPLGFQGGMYTVPDTSPNVWHQAITSYGSPSCCSTPPSHAELHRQCAQVKQSEDSDGEIDTLDAEDVFSSECEWEVVHERPEQWLESYGHTEDCSTVVPNKFLLQSLSESAVHAVQNAARYTQSVFQLLPQPCCEPRSFAFVKLREPENTSANGNSNGNLPSNFYAACVNAMPRGSSAARSEVLVVTARGCAHLFELKTASGGECILRLEHSFLSQSIWHNSSHLSQQPPFDEVENKPAFTSSHTPEVALEHLAMDATMDDAVSMV